MHICVGLGNWAVNMNTNNPEKGAKQLFGFNSQREWQGTFIKFLAFNIVLHSFAMNRCSKSITDNGMQFCHSAMPLKPRNGIRPKSSNSNIILMVLLQTTSLSAAVLTFQRKFRHHTNKSLQHNSVGQI